MIVVFNEDYAGKLAGQKADLDSSVAIHLLRAKIVSRIETEQPEKKLAEPKKKAGRPAKK